MPDQSQSAPYLPPNSEQFFTVQPLMGDNRPISFYEGPTHLPYCLKQKLSYEDCKPFLDSDKGPVTFTIRIPLRVLVSSTEAVREYIETTAFSFDVELYSCEYRATGACLSEFSEELAGEVLLQVTCAMSPSPA